MTDLLLAPRLFYLNAYGPMPKEVIMKRSWAGEVRNVSLLVASAVNSEGFREILDICEGAKEDKSGWSAFLRHLVDRGLKGVRRKSKP
jgi:transposase-like protein